MNFKPVTFSDVSAIDYSFTLSAPANRFEPYSHILAVHVSGEYRFGSAGSPDASLISGITQAAIAIWEPDALILDFRELSYEWGDEMDWICELPHGASEIPFALVLSERCLPAISTLFYGVDTTKKATERENVFEDFAKAADYVEEKLVAKRENLKKLYP